MNKRIAPSKNLDNMVLNHSYTTTYTFENYKFRKLQILKTKFKYGLYETGILQHRSSRIDFQEFRPGNTTVTELLPIDHF